MIKWIDSGDIKNWVSSKQRHCQQTLPELVRRLILATASTIEEIDFPSGDSIATGGWDGRLKTPIVTPFFPSGSSGWEIGVGTSPGKKAEEDYTDRTSDPLGLTPADTTFVFVTPRSFPKRGKWQSDKSATKIWKDVRVINADALEQWIQSAPAVGLWFARQIGKIIPGGIRYIEDVWEEWSIGTNPTMTTDLVIGGRTSDVEKIHNWLVQGPSILEVQGDRPDEVFAFLYASISGLPEIERSRALSRCVVVEDIKELRQLTQAFQNYPLIIAAPGECINVASVATAKGHHVLISMNAKVIGLREIFHLSRPQRGEVERILKQNGLSEVEAQKVARDFGRSIPVLHRYLFRSNAVSAPDWATNAKSIQLLIPILLVGAWDEAKEGDQQVIEILSGRSYDDFIKELIPFLSIDDSPIRKIGGVWMLKSPLDAWFLLATNLTTDALKLFEQSVLSVLTKTDPKYDLEPEQRWAAAIYGKANSYSEWLRTGLVELLVLLAVYGNRSKHIDSTQPFTNNVVKKIFAQADNWEAWASIKDVTPLLAEAAPDTFMQSVEQGISKAPDIFKELMKDDDSTFGECRHSGLLWALEGIAWSSEYFTRAVDVLTALAKIDPGGRWGNRAIKSLRDIFYPGLPQTHASPKERISLLEDLISRNPQMVWEFARGYYRGGSISESHRFRWRDTGGQRRGLETETNEEYREYLKGLLPKLSDLACSNENLISSLDEFTRLPYDVRDRLISKLGTTEPDSFSKEERARLLQSIRGALNWVNSYGDKDRRKQVPGLYLVLERFTPTDVIDRLGWLLSTPWPRLPQGELEHHEAKETAVKAAQAEAAREILDNVSLDKIFEFAGTIQYIGVLGDALGQVVRDDKEDADILDAMLGHMDKPILIRGYTGRRVKTIGPIWVDKQIERIKAQGNYSPEACALLYLGLPEESETWSAISVHGQEAEMAYWKQTNGYSYSTKEEDAPIAVEKLLDAGRPGIALKIAGEPKISLPSLLLQRLLQEILSINSKDRKFPAEAMDDYYLGMVFNQLYERNELPLEEIARLEWPFALLFEEIRQHTSSPMALHRLLKKEPSLFAQLISFIYKPDDYSSSPSTEDVIDEISENRAQVADKVLDSWYLIPGIKEDGTLDEQELTEWVEAARKQCAATKHIEGCDIQIGFMLANAPSDSDGTWPHIAVRNLIERLNNEIIESHIMNKIYNSRGIVSRGLSEGGHQERELATKYKKLSDAVKVKWPRSAAILRSVAESYERQAKSEDIQSDQRELFWG